MIGRQTRRKIRVERRRWKSTIVKLKEWCLNGSIGG